MDHEGSLSSAFLRKSMISLKSYDWIRSEDYHYHKTWASWRAMNFMIHEQMSKISLKQFSIALASALCWIIKSIRDDRRGRALFLKARSDSLTFLFSAWCTYCLSSPAPIPAALLLFHAFWLRVHKEYNEGCRVYSYRNKVGVNTLSLQKQLQKVCKHTKK